MRDKLSVHNFPYSSFFKPAKMLMYHLYTPLFAGLKSLDYGTILNAYGKEFFKMRSRNFMKLFKLSTRSLAFLPILLSAGQAIALPWDIDMYSQQSLRSNEVARAPVVGTVPLGHKPFTMTMDEAEKNLKNPTSFDSRSVWRGQRLWNVQCLPCHGASADSNTKIGKLLGAPNLLENRFDSYSDGRIYGTIMLGVRGMPRYGYKLSEEERWDIVNYLKFLKGKEVEGVKRPESK